MHCLIIWKIWSKSVIDTENYLTKGEFCLEKRDFSEKRQDLDFLETPHSVYIRFKS